MPWRPRSSARPPTPTAVLKMSFAVIAMRASCPTASRRAVRAYSPSGWRATKPPPSRSSFCQREPVWRAPEVSKRMPATSR